MERVEDGGDLTDQRALGIINLLPGLSAPALYTFVFPSVYVDHFWLIIAKVMKDSSHHSVILKSN